MEVQLANRIKVLEHAEKGMKLTEKECPDMYQYFIKKQVVLLKKMNEIKKTFNIPQQTSMGRTPGTVIREEHPRATVPLPKSSSPSEEDVGLQKEDAVDAEKVSEQTVPASDDQDVASLLLEVLGPDPEASAP